MEKKNEPEKEWKLLNSLLDEYIKFKGHNILEFKYRMDIKDMFLKMQRSRNFYKREYKMYRILSKLKTKEDGK